MNDTQTFNFESELKRQTEISLARMRQVLAEIEDDPEFPKAIALLKLKASFLDKKVIR